VLGSAGADFVAFFLGCLRFLQVIKSISIDIIQVS
jgi:hypothetical protein